MIKDKVCYAFIFARGGSKGVRRKNLKLLAEKPLIAYSIESAKKNKYIDKVIVSTEDQEIAEVAKSYGAEVPFLRPKELATDTAAEWLSWQHAINYIKDLGDHFDIFITLPSTSPLRADIDIVRCIEKFLELNTDVVITTKDAERSPWFNMIKEDEEGVCLPVIKPDVKIVRRQDAPLVFDMTTVAYVLSPEFILKNTGLFQGRVKQIVVPKERAIDIDTPFDFKLAEFLIMQTQKDSE